MSIHRACNDFHRTADAERSRFIASPLTRRQVLGAGLGAGLALYTTRALSLTEALQTASAEAAEGAPAPILVCVFLPGGLDLLDTLVPIGQEGRYADLRGGTRVTGAPKLGSTGYGIHPSLAEGAGGGVKGMFERGHVAFLPGIDYGNPDLSHFHSRHFWESGVVTNKVATGWLGRVLDHTGSKDNPFQGVTVSSTLSPVLRSAGAPVAAITNLGSVALPPFASSPLPELTHDALQELAAQVERYGGSGPAAVARSSRHAVEVARRLAGSPAAQQPERRENADGLLTGVANSGADTLLSRNLKTLVEVLKLPVGVRVATVTASGDFDTHANQPPRLREMLRDISTSLSQFQADIEAAGLGDRVTTLVWSEFGRRPKANRSAGTDHGAGGVAWVMGRRVRGGIATEYPDLHRFDDKGNLQVTVDFRRMYCSLLEQWLGVDAAAIIPDAAAFGRVGLIA